MRIGMQAFRRCWLVSIWLLGLELLSGPQLGWSSPLSRLMVEPNFHRYAAFIQNDGQWDPRARFALLLPGLSVWLTDSGMVLDQYRIEPNHERLLVPTVQRMGQVIRLVFASDRKPVWKTSTPVAGVYHFFYGGRQWTNVQRYTKVIADYGTFAVEYVVDPSWGGIRYNILLPTETDPSAITVRIDGADSVWIDTCRRLVLKTQLGMIVQFPPLAVTPLSARAFHLVPSAFQRQGPQSYRFSLPAIQGPIIVDPLVLSTFIGGANGDEVWGVAIGKNNEIFLTGRTISASFPVTVGAYQTSKNAQYDAFVVKLNAAGSALDYATFLGGSSDDYGNDIAVDQAGNAYVTGVTWSSDFPTVSAFSTQFGGQRDVFVTKLAADGASLVYSTFVGGLSWDDPSKIVVTPSGEAVVCGQTVSTNFPVTPNAISTVLNGDPSINTWDGFVFKLSAGGNQLVYSSFIGGRSLDEARGVSLDAQGNIYLTGRTISTNFPVTAAAYDTTLNSGDSAAFDAFVVKIYGNTGSLAWGTFLGGTSHDQGSSIVVLGNGNIAVGGGTQSSNFPASNAHAGGEDAFVAVLNATGTTLVAARFVGGSSTDRALDIAADATGIYLVGNTESGNFPTTNGAYDQSHNGARDAFGVKWNLSLSQQLYGTFLGGSLNEEGLSVDVDNSGHFFIAGYTLSANFPTTTGVFDSTFGGAQGDGFVAKIGTLPPQITLQAPQGGESWCVGTPVTVRWQSRSVQEVKILLSDNGGVTYPLTLAEHVPAAYGYWVWNIDPGLPAGTAYRLRIQDQYSATVVDESQNFTLNVPPTILSHPDSLQVCVGDTAIFIVAAEGLPQPIAQWQRSSDGGNSWEMLNVTGDTLVVFPVQASMDGYLYRAVFQNVCDNGVASQPALLSVLLQPQILQQPESQVVCVGDTLILEVGVDQTDVQYQWRKDGKNLPGYRSRTLIIPDVTPAMAGRYDVVITGRCPPPVVSEIAEVQVQDVPQLAETPSFRPVECRGDVLDTVLKLFNTGPLDVTVHLVAIDNADFSFPSAFPIAIPSGEIVEIPVRFVPSKAGIAIGVARFQMEPCSVEFEVTMGVRVDSIHLQASPVDFGLVYQCDTVQIRSVTVVNTGTVPLRVDTVLFSSSQFKLQAPVLPVEIAPQAQESFLVQFIRQGGNAVVQETATLVTNRCEYQLQIPLQAEQDSLFFTASVTQLVFDTLFDCNSVSQQRLFLFNPTDRPIQIVQVLSSNPAFGFVDPPVPFLLSPKSPRWVTVEFSGGNGGWNTGTMTIRAEQCDVQQTIELRGYQVLPSLEMPPGVQFAMASLCEVPDDTLIWVVNHHTEPIRVDSIVVNSPFQIVGVTLPAMIPSGDSLPVTIRLNASTEGDYQEIMTLYFTGSQCIGRRSSSLFARISDPRISAAVSTPVSVIADTCQQSAYTVVPIVNASRMTIKLEGATFQTPYFQIAGGIPQQIGVQDTIFLSIRFIPPAAGNFTDTLLLAYQPCQRYLKIPVVGYKAGVSIVLIAPPIGDTLQFDPVVLCPGQEPVLLEREVVLTAAGSEGVDSLTIEHVSVPPPFDVAGITAGQRFYYRDTLRFRLRFSPAAVGRFSGQLQLVLSPCQQLLRVPLSATVSQPLIAVPPKTFIGNTTVGVPIQTQLVWYNLSSVPIIVKGLWSDRSTFTPTLVLPTTLPAMVAAGDSIVVRVEFQSQQIGPDSAWIALQIDKPCSTLSTTLVWAQVASLPSVRLWVSDTVLDFGVVVIGQQGEKKLLIGNQGTVRAIIDSATIRGAHASEFRLLQIPPLVLDTGQTVELSVQFEPLMVGKRTAELRLFAEEQHLRIPLRGVGIPGTAAAIVQLPHLDAQPGDRLDIPLKIIPDQHSLLSVLDSFSVWLRFKSAVLFVHQTSRARQITDTIIGKWRRIELRGSVTDTMLAILHTEVLLGDTLATPLIIDSVRWVPSVVQTVRLHGLVRIRSDFVIRLGKPFGIVNVVPQPVQSEGQIFIQTPYTTEHFLTLYDLAGRRLWRYRFVPQRQQTESVIIIPLPPLSWSAGTYVLKLETIENEDYYLLPVVR